MKSKKILAIVKEWECGARFKAIVWLVNITLMTRLSRATVIRIYWIIISFQRYWIYLQVLSFRTKEPLHITTKQFETYCMEKFQINEVDKKV